MVFRIPKTSRAKLLRAIEEQSARRDIWVARHLKYQDTLRYVDKNNIDQLGLILFGRLFNSISDEMKPLILNQCKSPRRWILICIFYSGYNQKNDIGKRDPDSKHHRREDAHQALACLQGQL